MNKLESSSSSNGTSGALAGSMRLLLGSLGLLFASGTPASAFTRPGTAPEPNTSDTVLVTKIIYDAAGRQSEMVDNKGIRTVRQYDALGRVTKMTEHYVDGTPGNDNDRITLYAYNADGQITEQTADLPTGTDDQTTKYIYSAQLTDKGSVVKSNSYLRAVIYPDSDDVVSSNALANGTDTTYDRVEMTYLANGALATRKDQRGVELTFVYDDAGRRIEQKITAGTIGGDQQVKYTYTDLGQVEKITTYAVIDFLLASEVKYTYNGLGQIVGDAQEHASYVNANSPIVSYAFDDTASSNRFTKGMRLESTTYPNSRVVHTLYSESGGSNGINDAIGRTTALATDNTRGTSDANVIASYAYLGDGTVVLKDYPTPDVRLDYTGSDYDGFDRFGRIVRQQWYDYGASVDLIRIDHGYDRASNRLFADNTTHKSAAQHYTYDNLNRLTTFKSGQLTRDGSGIPNGVRSSWTIREQAWTFDTLGNPLAIRDHLQNDWSQGIFNKANEFSNTAGSLKIKSGGKPFTLNDQFSSDTSADYEKPGTGDAFTISGGVLKFTTVAQDTLNGQQEQDAVAFVLVGESIGPSQILPNWKLPSGTTSGFAGLILGYKHVNDYWMYVGNIATQKAELYHVVNGSRTLIKTMNWSIPADTFVAFSGYHRRKAVAELSLLLPEGHPSGRVGLVTNVTNAEFTYLQIPIDSVANNELGRWMDFTPGAAPSSISGSKWLVLNGFWAGTHLPKYLGGLRLGNRWEVSFAARSDTYDRAVNFVFNGKDNNWYNTLAISHHSKTAPSGSRVVDGSLGQSVAGTANTANIPTIGVNDVAWMRIRCDGTTITAYVATTEAGLDTASACYTSSNFTLDGGYIGFRAFQYYIDKLTVKGDRDADGTYEIIEYFDDFETNGSNQALETPAYDKAGNLTWDGNYRYVYDAWNQQIEVYKSYRDSVGTIQGSSIFAGMRYDGRGRRIIKTIYRMADFDGTFHYYYDGDRVIEQRNGSDQVLKQYVWGMQYIDELVQVAINQDPQNATTGTYTENMCERFYWTLQDANFNIVGVVAPDGRLIERYEYTPYGERTVFTHGRLLADLNDDGAVDGGDISLYLDAAASSTADSLADVNGDGQVNGTDHSFIISSLGLSWPSNDPQVSYRVEQSFRGSYWGNVTGTPLCEVGHQGLMHDEELGLIYNRARTLHPQLQRFCQRDPVKYVDGMNAFQYLRSAPTRFMDWTGTRPITLKFSAFLAKSKGVSIYDNPIPDVQWIKEPAIWHDWDLTGFIENMMSTDNREKAGEPGTSRLQTIVTFDSDNVGELTQNNNVTASTTPGVSHRIMGYFNAIGQWGPTWYVPGTLEARSTTVDFDGTVTDLNSCESRITVSSGGNYPFILGAPDINYTITWDVKCLADGRVLVKASGSHNEFPAYEAIANQQLIYESYPPASAGPGLFNVGVFWDNFETDWFEVN